MRSIAKIAAFSWLFFISAAANAQSDSGVFRQSLYVPVRDGTKLAVNIYRPETIGKLPVIFAFTPYRARFKSADGQINEIARQDRLALKSLIAAGYVVAVADIRGKGASFGSRRGFQDRTEAQDGYDLIEWLAKQPFSSGKVGMIGCSYLGGTTFQTATTTPPSLEAVFVGATDLDKYGFVRRGGITAQFNTRPDEPLSDDLMSVPVDEDTDGAMLKAAVAQHAGNTPMAGLWYGMPYRDSRSQYTANAFWDEVAVYPYLAAIKKAGIATYFWGNWQDEPTAQVILSAANMNGSKFLAGPGGHCVPPPDFDFTGEVRRYFDHYLKGMDNGIEREPRATYWVDGLPKDQAWVKSATLPGVGGKRTPSFLGAESLLVPKATASGSDMFTVDYNLPSADYFAFWAKPMPDKGLSYTSAVLTMPLKLIGFPIIRLSISSDKPDANVFAYIDQIAPDGTAEVISFGRLALSHRKTSAAPFASLGLPWHSGLSKDVTPLQPGTPTTLDFDLTPVSRVIPVGSILRVVITGADPRQRNLAQIKQTPPPMFTIDFGGASGSRIELPLSPEARVIMAK